MSDITVNDRRTFTKDGQLNEAAPEAAQGPQAGPGPVPEPSAADPAGGASMGDVPATLSTLIIGLATSVMIQLGEHSPDGQSPPQKPDFPAAKHSIDLLGVLEAKTRGNLDEG
jgi:hypothetical protein